MTGDNNGPCGRAPHGIKRACSSKREVPPRRHSGGAGRRPGRVYVVGGGPHAAAAGLLLETKASIKSSTVMTVPSHRTDQREENLRPHSHVFDGWCNKQLRNLASFRRLSCRLMRCRNTPPFRAPGLTTQLRSLDADSLSPFLETRAHLQGNRRRPPPPIPPPIRAMVTNQHPQVVDWRSGERSLPRFCNN